MCKSIEYEYIDRQVLIINFRLYTLYNVDI